MSATDGGGKGQSGVPEPFASIARSVRDLASAQVSPAERVEFGGRLVRDALRSGAFNAPSLVGMRVAIETRLDYPLREGRVHPFISAWGEAAYWARKASGVALDGHDITEDFPADCELVASMIESATTATTGRANPEDTDPPVLEFTTTDLRATSDPLWQRLRTFERWMAADRDYAAGCLFDTMLDLFSEFHQLGLKAVWDPPFPCGELWKLPDGREVYAGQPITDKEKRSAVKEWYFIEPGPMRLLQAIPAHEWPERKLRPQLARWAQLWARERERQLAGVIPQTAAATNQPESGRDVSTMNTKSAAAVVSVPKTGWFTHSDAARALRAQMKRASREMSHRQAKNAVSSAMRNKNPPFTFEGSKATLRIEGITFLAWAQAKCDREMDASG